MEASENSKGVLCRNAFPHQAPIVGGLGAAIWWAIGQEGLKLRDEHVLDYIARHAFLSAPNH